jgi:hypothetical protein
VNIFEDFDIGAVSFLSEYSLDVLLENSLITSEQANKSRELRRVAFELKKIGEWKIELFGRTDQWKKLLSLADEINVLLNREVD